MKKLIENPKYRLFIRIVDKDKEIRVDETGRQWIATKWIEVNEADFGSLNIPNKEIIQFRLEPIKYENEEKAKNISLSDIFKSLSGDFK